MLDIIFISYDEPNADKNYAALKARFSHAKRVHGVKGIANAHIAASKKAMTRFFYVVDGDTTIHPDFDFNYKPGPGDEEFVHVWYAQNPALGISYGYGGVKLFAKSFFKNVKSQLDFTTTLTKDIKVIPQTVCTTHFNSDHHRAFRGAFREAAKLYKTTVDETKPSFIRLEAEDRLRRWLDPIQCSFREFVLAGARRGVEEAKARDDVMFVNDHDLMNNLLTAEMISTIYSQHPEIDLNTSPVLPSTHPMKPEFFFTTRIASVLYDSYVLNSVPITELRDAISDGQMLSKLWLVEQLKLIGVDGKRVVILGGWLGTLSLLMHAHDLPVSVVSVDLDPRANRVAEKLNYDFKNFSTFTMDMYAINYDDFDIIINTSSEHIPNIAEWRQKIPPGKLVVVQNNNFLEGEGHISCVDNSEQLRQTLALSEVLYEGTRKFPAYDRYMLIGRT